MKSKLKEFILIFSLLFPFSVELYAQLYDGVCRLSSAAGFESEGVTGRAVCGDYTSNISEAKIFITTKDGHVYAHSNYITPGYDFIYPTKVASSSKMGLDDISMNLFFAEQPSDLQFASMQRALRNNVEVIIDPKLIDDPEYGTRYFDNISNLSFLCPDGKSRSSIKIRKMDGGFEFGIKYNNQFSTRVNNQNLSFLFLESRTRKIDFDNIRVINLVENSSTKEVLIAKFGQKNIDFDYSSSDNFKNLLLANKGTRTVILGHIEDGNFVTLKNGTEVFKISISEIQSFQKENKLELIILGCNSANEGAGSGALNKFNSIDAINRLKTTEKTKNVEEFLDSLSMGTIHFLLDETFFRTYSEPTFQQSNNFPERIEFSVFDRPSGEVKTINTSESKGKIIFLGMGTAEYALPIRSSQILDTLKWKNAGHLRYVN